MDCLLVIPILDVPKMKAWEGEPYDVLVVASSQEVYKWMKVNKRYLKQDSATRKQALTATEALTAAVTDLLHSLTVSSPITDGTHLVEQHGKCQVVTPTTEVASIASTSTKGSRQSRKENRSISLSGGSMTGLKAVATKSQRLEKTRSKIEKRGFPMPKLQPNIGKPPLKLSLESLEDVPDPLALATKAAINWSAFATDGDMKLLSGCRASPTMECDGDSRESILEETFIPTLIDVPHKQLVQPTARQLTRDRSFSPTALCRRSSKQHAVELDASKHVHDGRYEDEFTLR